MTELTDRQRKEYLQRHLANALFDKLSRGRWHVVTSGESSTFKVLGAGQAPRNPYDSSPLLYAWLATVSTSLPKFGLPKYAIFLDSKVYGEFMGQFTINTCVRWDDLVDSGTRRLYHLQDNTFRRNNAVPKLMCAIGTGLIERLEESKLIVPIENHPLDYLESDDQQLVLALLRRQEA